MTHLWQNPKLRVDMRVKCSTHFASRIVSASHRTPNKQMQIFPLVFIAWKSIYWQKMGFGRVLTFNESMKSKIWFTSCEYDMLFDIFCCCCCCWCLCCFYLGAQFVSFYFDTSLCCVALFLRVLVSDFLRLLFASCFSVSLLLDFSSLFAFICFKIHNFQFEALLNHVQHVFCLVLRLFYF